MAVSKCWKTAADVAATNGLLEKESVADPLDDSDDKPSQPAGSKPEEPEPLDPFGQDEDEGSEYDPFGPYKEPTPLPEGWTFDIAEAIRIGTRLADALDLGEGNEEYKFVFHLARRMKSYVAQRKIDLGPKGVAALKPVLQGFCSRLLQLDKCLCVDFEEEEDRWLEFVHCWLNVKHLDFENPLDAAYRLALERPIQLFEDFGSETLVAIASLAYHLQIFNGDDEPILLPVVLMGQKFGRTKQDGSRAVQMLDRTGLIELLDDANYHAKKAKRFRFRLERTDIYSPPSV